MHLTRTRAAAAILTAFVALMIACSSSSPYAGGGRALTPPDSDGGIDLIPVDSGPVDVFQPVDAYVAPPGIDAGIDSAIANDADDP